MPVARLEWLRDPQVKARIRRGDRARLRWVLWLLAAFLVLHHVIALAQFGWANRFFDFAHYYLYARNVVEGRSLFDLEAPRRLAEELGILYAESPPNYPPPFYVGLGLLALLPYRLASVAWLLLSEALLLAALVWRGAGGLLQNRVRMAALGLIVLAFQPLYETLALGQANVLLLAGITLMVRLWGAGSPWSGVVLGLVVLVKPQFALLGLLWLHRTDWRHLRAAAATVLTVSLGSVVVVSPDTWMNYLAYVRTFPCDISLWMLNLSLRGFLFRLKGTCAADGFGDPLAGVASLLGAVVIAAVALHLWRNPPADVPARFRAAGLVLCAVVLVAPYSQEHHLTVLLVVFAGLALDPRRPLTVFERLAWVAAYVLQATAYSLVRFPGWHLGLPSLLLYGKGLGIILLAFALVAGPRRGQPDSGSLLPTLLTAAVGARAAHAVLKGILLGAQDPTARITIAVAAAVGVTALLLVARGVAGRHDPSRAALWFPVLTWGPLIAAIQAGQILPVAAAAVGLVWAAWWTGRRPARDGANPPTWPARLLGVLAGVTAFASLPVLALGMLIPFVARAAVVEPSSTTWEDLGWALAFAGAGARPGWFTAETIEGTLTAFGPPLRAVLLLAAAGLLLWPTIREARPLEAVA